MTREPTTNLGTCTRTKSCSTRQYRQADEKWQKKEPKDRKIALRDWAYSLRQQKHYEQAVEKYREAIRVDENDPWTYYLR
jgi:tetratricopeptide (TPR) repeat protein